MRRCVALVVMPVGVVKAARSGKTAGFTLVELLVVIGIIAVLIAVLLPTLAKAREQANAAACMSNMRQISMAGLMFANEHKGYLIKFWYNDKPLMRGTETWGYRWPQYGWTYILNLTIKNKNVFDCPSVRPTQLRGLLASTPTTPNLTDAHDADDIPSAYRMNASDLIPNSLGVDSVKITMFRRPSKAILFVEGAPRDPKVQPNPADEPWQHVATWDNTADALKGHVSPTNKRNIRYNQHNGKANYGFVDGHVELLAWDDTWKPIGPRVLPLGYQVRQQTMWRQLYMAYPPDRPWNDAANPTYPP